MNINYIRQEDKYGCALACMAMILGISYKEIKNMWPEKYGTHEGVADFMQASFLFTKGYLNHTEYKTEAHTQRKRKPSEWIKPFAPMHIVSAITSNGPHALLWMSDRRVYDPNMRGIQKISDYNVQGITGYWELANFLQNDIMNCVHCGDKIDRPHRFCNHDCREQYYFEKENEENK